VGSGANTLWSYKKPEIAKTLRGQKDTFTAAFFIARGEMTEHLVLHCSAHEQARRDIWPGAQFNMDPRRLWDFLERIGAVTRPPDRE